MPSNCLILCRPLLFLPSIFPSIRIFSNELALHIRWPKYWSFSISEHSVLISGYPHLKNGNGDSKRLVLSQGSKWVAQDGSFHPLCDLRLSERCSQTSGLTFSAKCLTGFHLRLSAILGVKLYLSCLLSVTAPHTPLKCSGSSLMSLPPTPQTVSLFLKTEFPSLVHRPHISQMCKDALSTEKSRVQHHVTFSFLCTNKSQKRQ